jgi:Na+-transporting methylmalonyl-CoA/oxaloacetate decarboxylase gamma subunit
MYLVAIAWIYVVLMMALAEALSAQGTVLGALVTFVLYGLLPLSVVLYIMGTPLRRRVRLAQERAPTATETAPTAAPAAETANLRSDAPDRSRVAPGDGVAPIRKEP